MTAIASPLEGIWEQAARAFEHNAPDVDQEQADEESWATPGTLARRVTPKTVQTQALELIDAALIKLMDTPDGRLIITMPPQEGKSTRAAKDFVVWVLKHRPWTRVVTASYDQKLANRNGRQIRNMILTNPELGLKIASDNGSVAEWQIAGREGGLVSVGIGAGLTGRPADLMVIDDPIKDRKEADSELFRQRAWDWWTDVASTRLAPGAPVVLMLTRWHEDDLAGRLMKAEDGHLWRELRIPAEADHDPAKGETDPLDREPGEFLASARQRTDAQWEAIKVSKGARTWQALYQGRPSSAAGTIFLRDRWRYYDVPLWLEREDGARILHDVQPGTMLTSWDMTFKDTRTSDYVVGQVWLRRGADAFLLDQVRGRMDMPATIRAFKQLAAKWPQALLHLVEDKANGPAVIASLRHQIPGIVPVEPDGGKVSRANAAAPFQESGNLWLPDPELAPWIGDFVEECAAFPTATHDDQVDGMTQAVDRLIVQPLLSGEMFDVGSQLGDDMAEADARGWYASPY